VLGLYYISTSLLPHIWPYLTAPVLLIPFFAVYSLRDKTIFPYLLAFSIGVLADAYTANGIYINTIIFILIVALGKVVFTNLTNYGLERTSYLLSVVGSLLIYIFDFGIIVSNLANLNLYMIIGLNIFTNTVVVFIWYRFGQKYLDYVEKTTSERFR
jgi:divalent metal cation (Fe/Co/Zn/Cd) transporter